MNDRKEFRIELIHQDQTESDTGMIAAACESGRSAWEEISDTAGQSRIMGEIYCLAEQGHTTSRTEASLSLPWRNPPQWAEPLRILRSLPGLGSLPGIRSLQGSTSSAAFSIEVSTTSIRKDGISSPVSILVYVSPGVVLDEAGLEEINQLVQKYAQDHDLSISDEGNKDLAALLKEANETAGKGKPDSLPTNILGTVLALLAGIGIAVVFFR